MAVAVAVIVIAVVLLPVLLIRFRKRWVAAFNLAVVNRISGRFAGRLPGFGMLTHTGRISGRMYHTPVNVFREGNEFTIALTYGQEARWVQNVLAAGGCRLETRGVQYQLSEPTIVHDPTRRQFPVAVGLILRIIGASDFLRLRAQKANASADT